MKLCCEAEDENTFDRHAVAVLKAMYIAIFLQVVSQPDSAYRPRRQDDGLRKPSEISEKGQDQFSNYFLHASYTSTLATRVHVQELQCSTANRLERPAGGGGGACNGGKITLYSNFARK